MPPQVPWVGDVDNTRLGTCSTVGAKGSNQVSAIVYHQPLGEPHATANALAEHWKSQGFTESKRMIDWTKGDYTVVEIAAERADGVSYDLLASTHNMSIQAWSECSTGASFQAWNDGWPDREHPQKATPTP